MIATPKPQASTPSRDSWQEEFLELLPRIEASLQSAYRHLRGDSRAEAVQEGLANALLAYRRLCERGQADLAYPTVLARYAVKQFFVGRRVATRLNAKDVMSPYCHHRQGVRLKRLDGYDPRGWSALLVEDKHAGPADIVPLRIDFAEWLKTLAPRQRRIANALASGETTAEAACTFQLSGARISQLRQELRHAWRSFQGELAPA